MKLEIELERLKKVDFLNLFEIKLDDYDFNDYGNPCNFKYKVSKQYEIYDTPYNILIKYLKRVYKNIIKYNKFLIRCINNEKCPKERKELFLERIQKIEKYLLNQKLNQKFTEIKKTKVNKI